MGVRPTVVLDTMTLIRMYHVAENEPRDDSERRVRWLLNDLSDRDAHVCIPAVVLAEFLAGIAPKDRGATLAALQENFTCIPLTAKAAEHAAALFDAKKDFAMAATGARQVFKADTLVVATAAAFSPTEFHSQDAQCQRLARLANLTIGKLPDHSDDIFESAGGTRVAPRRSARGATPVRKKRAAGKSGAKKG